MKWTELLDKFRTTQDRARRSSRPVNPMGDGGGEGQAHGGVHDVQRKLMPGAAEGHGRQRTVTQGSAGSAATGRSKFSAGSLGMARFTGGVKARGKK